LADGRVEIFAQGDPEQVDKIVDWAWAGPSHASVNGVESELSVVDPTITDFFIQPNPAPRDR
jgi:acylphosphatase